MTFVSASACTIAPECFAWLPIVAWCRFYCGRNMSKRRATLRMGPNRGSQRLVLESIRVNNRVAAAAAAFHVSQWTKGIKAPSIAA